MRAAGECGVSRGPQRASFRRSCGSRRSTAGRVRIGRWVLRPSAGWELQEAPLMLPAARFAEALAAAAGQGLSRRRQNR